MADELDDRVVVLSPTLEFVCHVRQGLSQHVDYIWAYSVCIIHTIPEFAITNIGDMKTCEMQEASAAD